MDIEDYIERIIDNGKIEDMQELSDMLEDTMEIIKESDETVAENSVLVQDNGEYYCIVQNGNNYTLAKYDADLNLKLKSNSKLKPATPVTVAGQYIVVTGADGTVKVLNKSDLNEIYAKGNSFNTSTADAK